jgi:hypothetical protein
MARTSRLHARHREYGLPHMVTFLAVILLGISATHAQPAVLQPSDCFSGSNTQQKLNISTVYAQVIPESNSRARLNFTLIGTTPETIVEASADQNNPVASASTAVCSIRVN